MHALSRREFLHIAALGALGTVCSPRESRAALQPNIVLIMCDDLGYGDTGFNGNTVIRTPHLDALCGEGARFTRFYAGGPVCSPTRGTCLTGRHYARYGIMNANSGFLPEPEITIAEMCRGLGYRTGHFGKWHLGTLTKTEKDGNRGGKADEANVFSPPQQHGFDVCFSTESKVPTWDPAITPAEGKKNLWGEPGSPWTTAFWNERGERVTDNLAGDDSRVIVDRVEPFIRQTVADQKPFLSVVWFHTPHAPVVAGPEYRAMYAQYPESQQHYYGSITAMDEQVGRLNAVLKELGVDQNTIVFFCSDNGPEGYGDGDLETRNQGSAGKLRGRKRSLFCGGVGVPALVKWPGVVTPGATLSMPCSTLDYFPTLAEAVGYTMPDARPLDGVNLRGLFTGTMSERLSPIPFFFQSPKKYMFDSPTLGLIDNRYAFLSNLSEDRAEDCCFDLVNDPSETKNLIADMQPFADASRARLAAFVESSRRSHSGADYSEPFQPSTPFPLLTGTWPG